MNMQWGGGNGNGPFRGHREFTLVLVGAPAFMRGKSALALSSPTDSSSCLPRLAVGAQDDESVGEPTERRPLCGSLGTLQIPSASLGMTISSNT
jgi:hypothetical protein